MDKAQENKSFILEYVTAMSGNRKSEALIRQYVSDEKLIAHILFFEKTFPQYRAVIEEILAEDDRVFIRTTIKGIHEGAEEGIPPTHRVIKAPFAICYKIENRKIVDHWMIADQMELMEQLGLLETENTYLPPKWEKVS